MSILSDIKANHYAIGDLCAVRYDRNSPQFPDGYLAGLYFGLGEGRRNGFRRSNLQTTFSGMTDLSFDAVVSYLAMQQLVIVGKWEDSIFRTAGLCWLNMFSGERRTAMGSYALLRWVWGRPEEEILTTLGLAMLFEEFSLVQLHGQRYADNHLSVQFMSRFGFRDVGRVPRLLARGSEMVDGVISTLSREDFEANCEQRIAAARARISVANI